MLVIEEILHLLTRRIIVRVQTPALFATTRNFLLFWRISHVQVTLRIFEVAGLIDGLVGYWWRLKGNIPIDDTCRFDVMRQLGLKVNMLELDIMCHYNRPKNQWTIYDSSIYVCVEVWLRKMNRLRLSSACHHLLHWSLFLPLIPLLNLISYCYGTCRSHLPWG